MVPRKIDKNTKNAVLDVFDNVWPWYDEDKGHINMYDYKQIMLQCKQYKQIKDYPKPDSDPFVTKNLEYYF